MTSKMPAGPKKYSYRGYLISESRIHKVWFVEREGYLIGSELTEERARKAVETLTWEAIVDS